MSRRTRRLLRFDLLESRVVLNGDVLTIPMIPEFDQFGDQIISVQAYGDAARSTFGIFDTGASALTFGALDQELFSELGIPIPIKVPGGAIAEGIGGIIVGDVSEPGTIIADGLHVADLIFDENGFPIFDSNFDENSARTPGIQAFVGTEDGSPGLPTITGTPQLNPSSNHPNGLAAQMDMQGYLLDFSDLIEGLTLAIPDLRFVAPGTEPIATAETFDPIFIPMSFFGGDNYLDPGDSITETPSPTQAEVALAFQGATTQRHNFLYDTGAQLSVISTQVALNLGLDLDNPETTIEVTGVGGTVEVPGYTIDSLEMPRTDGGLLRFTDVPIYVLDVHPALDGILGMNLWNTASTMIYDPHGPLGPRLGVTFFKERDLGDDGDFGEGYGDFLGGLFGGPFGGAFGGQNVPRYNSSRGASISGQMFEDMNGNGRYDRNEPGLAGMTVYIDRNRNGRLDAVDIRTETDASGSWWFDGLKAGTYVVREVLPRGWIRTLPRVNAHVIRLAADQQAVAYQFGNLQLGSITGTVFNDANQNGQRDPDENGMRRVPVYIDRNHNGRRDSTEPRVFTNTDGVYLFRNLRPGTYRVSEIVPRLWQQSSPAEKSYTVVVTSGLNATDQDFVNYRPSATGGRASPSVPPMGTLGLLDGSVARLIAPSAFEETDK